MLIDPVGHEAFERADGHWTVQLAPATFCLAGMVTDATYGGRERVVFHHYLECFRITASTDEIHIPLGTGLSGTGCFAGRCSPLGDGVLVGYSLRIGLVDRRAHVQRLVKLVGQRHRTNRNAVSARGALFQVYVARAPAQGGFKTSCLSFQVDEIGVRKKLDVGMAPGIHQFGRADAHRTVVRGKGLVQLSHFAADGR